MNEDIELMMDIYETYEVDWMGDSFSDPSQLTRHHIIKRERGGENGVSNYALLTQKSHILLHYLEKYYYQHSFSPNLSSIILDIWSFVILSC